MLVAPEAVRAAYQAIIVNPEFQDAVDSDTAGIPHTSKRFQIVGEALSEALEVPIQVPQALPNEAGQLRFVV